LGDTARSGEMPAASQSLRSRSPTPDGVDPIFDFDVMEEAEHSKGGGTRQPAAEQPRAPAVHSSAAEATAVGKQGAPSEVGDQGVTPRPHSMRAFCEAVQLSSALRARDPDAFEGLEWCLSSDSKAPLGRVMRGRWQDVDNGRPGEVLLHGLPAGRPLLIRALESQGGAVSASAWTRVTTKALPADCGEHRGYDLLGRARGGIPGLCNGWVLMQAQDDPSLSPSAFRTLQASRCLRCGVVDESHRLEAKEQAAAKPALKAGDGEQYVVVIKPCVSAYAEPDMSTPALRNFLFGEFVWLFEWDETKKWRRCVCEGDLDNPQRMGWVMVNTWKYGALLVPQNEGKLRELCSNDPHGVMSSLLDDWEQERSSFHREKELTVEINSRISDKRVAWRAQTLNDASYVRRATSRCRLEVGDGRLVLGPRPRPPGQRRRFDKVLVMGAHHTCTTALSHELVQQFKVEVVNDYNGILSPELRPENYKHRVLRSPPSPDDALVICLVKDPFFWLQSLSRHGAIYAVKPVAANPATGEFQDRDLQLNAGICDLAQDKLLDHLLDHVEFLGDVYEDGALGVWEATVRSYFDPLAYPLERTAVVRAEDFLFHFDAVMAALCEIGLERHQSAPPPTERPIKEGVMHPHTRGRPEALSWYGQEENRFVGFKPWHKHVVFERLGPELLKPLRYGRGAAARWAGQAGEAWTESDEEETLAPAQQSRPCMWAIVGGGDKGGVLVREGPGLSSRKAAERLSTGALVEEVSLLDCGTAGERLQYRRLTGTGPEEGWISVALNHKVLAERVEAAP